MKISLTNQQGAALLEAIVALGAVVVAVAGIAVVVTASVSNSQFIQDQNRANKYAQEGMEYIKSFKEESYSTFTSTFSTPGEQCMNDSFVLSVATADCNGQRVGGNKFVRKVRVVSSPECQSGGQPGHKAIVSVNWQSSKCDTSTNSFCHKSELQTCFAPPPASTL